MHQTEPGAMLGLAMAEFRKGDAGAAAATLDRLLAANPDFNSTEADLLAARILEAKGRLPEALSAYEPSSAASWRTSIRYPRSAAYPLARAVRQLAALLGSISPRALEGKCFPTSCQSSGVGPRGLSARVAVRAVLGCSRPRPSPMSAPTAVG